EALATSGAACAATLGKLDGEVTREEALTHAGLIVSVSACPVAGDLENGFGHAPETVAETIRFAAAAGLAGGSIEDASGDPAAPIYEFEHAVDRVAAAAAEARRHGFVLTARAENFVHDRPDLDDTVRRLQAYERAGADVLFARGLPDLAAVRAGPQGAGARARRALSRSRGLQAPDQTGQPGGVSPGCARRSHSRNPDTAA